MGLVQGSNEWRQFRLEGVGASDVPAIVGCSPYQKREELLKEKVTGESKPINQFVAQRGHQVEIVAREYAQIHLLDDFVPMCYQSDSTPWLRASMDGVSLVGVGIECKFVGAEIFTKTCFEDDVINLMHHFYIQIQVQYFVTELRQIYLVLVDSKNNKKIIEISRDQQMIDKLLPQIKTFWDEVLANRKGIVPVQLAATEECKIEKKAIKNIDNENLSILLSKRDELKTKIDSLEEQLKNLDNDIYLVFASCDSEAIKCGEWRIETIKRKGNIQYNKIPELDKVDLEKYRQVDTVFRKISKLKDK